MEFVLRRLREAIPFTLMAGGSSALFLANMVGKRVFAAETYGSYSYLITLASVIVTFGMLGLDQAIVRTSELRDGALYLSRRTAMAALLALLASCTLAGGLMAARNLPDPVLGATFLAVIAAGYLAYQFNRTRGHLASAQLLNNVWRAAVLVGILGAGLFEQGTRYSFVLTVGIIATCATTTPLILSSRSSWRFDKDIPLDTKMTFGFLATMVTAATLTYGDRFIIENRLGSLALGDYFYLQNIFLFPLTMIATYTGFKEVHAFKKDRTIAPIHRSLLVGAGISILFLFVYLVAIHFTSVVPTDQQNICVLLVLLGMTRIPYASLSAAQSVHANAADLHLANVISIVSFVLGLVAMLNIGFSVERIVAAQIVAWASRLVFVYVRVRRRLDLLELQA